MHIKMLQTRRGTEDGYIVQLFEQGNQYDIGDALAKRFISAGYAQAIETEKDINEETVTKN